MNCTHNIPKKQFNCISSYRIFNICHLYAATAYMYTAHNFIMPIVRMLPCIVPPYKLMLTSSALCEVMICETLSSLAIEYSSYRLTLVVHFHQLAS